jgi:competence protein ComEC
VNDPGEAKRTRIELRVDSLPRGDPDPWMLLERHRERASRLLARADPYGLLRKLVLNERVPGSPQGFLRQLGFVHLLTATGIHLYFLAGAVAWLGWWALLGCGLPQSLALWLARAAAASAVLGAWMLSGLRPGMLRPWILVGLRRGAAVLGIRWRPWAPLLLALGMDGAVALWRATHGESWAPGRLHYALAVGGGMMALQACARDSRRAGIRGHFAMAVGSWVCVALLEIWQQATLAAATPVLSLISIPFYSSLIYPGALFAIAINHLPGGSAAAAWTASVLGWLASEFTLALAAVALRARTLWIVPPGALACGMIAAALLLRAPPRWRLALPLVFAGLGRSLLPLAMGDPHGPPAADRIAQLDVGQGDAALIRRGNEAGLIDAGEATALAPEAWLRVLAREKVSRLRYVGLTHLDADHAGGLTTLASVVPIDCVLIASDLRASERAAAIGRAFAALPSRFEGWREGCFPFAAIENLRAKKGGAGNRSMSGAFIPLAGGSAYLNLGDADESQEEAALPWLRSLRERHPGDLILKVSHHGSRFSSSRKFLQAVAPVAAWISAGVGNRHGHPTLQTLERLEGIPIRRTDREGAIRAGGDHRRR